MLRPKSPQLLLLIACVATSLTGCKTIYSDTYSDRHNYFKAPKPVSTLTAEEKKAAAEAARATANPAPAPAPAAGAAIPGLDAGNAAPAPAPAMEVPGVPGLQ